MDISKEQIEKVKKLYKRVCDRQKNSPYDDYDTTEIHAIQDVCRILKIKLD